MRVQAVLCAEVPDVSVILVVCSLCVFLHMCLFVLCVLCLTVNCLVNAFAICVSEENIFSLKVIVLFFVG